MKYFIIRYNSGFYEYKMAHSLNDVIYSLKKMDCFTNVEEIKECK